MSAFGYAIEQGRINGAMLAGISKSAIDRSLNNQFRSLVTERTQSPINPFDLIIDGSDVTAVGFEHRGDLGNTYALSIKEAADAQRAERFSLENQGYEKAKEKFFELPLNSTVVLMSPPPEVPIEGYPGYSLMYFYHILPGEKEGQRTIKALSFINKFEKEEQVEILKAIDPQADVEPTERSILLTPVAIKGAEDGVESFRKMWEAVSQIYDRKERDFAYMPTEVAKRFLLEGADYWGDRNRDLEIVIEEVSKLIAEGRTPGEIKDEWKLMFNLADRGLLHQDFTDPDFSTSDSAATFATVYEQNKHLIMQKVREVATSCGRSGDLTEILDTLAPLKNDPIRKQLMNPLALLDSNSPVQTKTFTAENAKDDPNLCKCGNKAAHFHCGGKLMGGRTCKQEITVGLGIKECPSCGNGKVC